VKRIPVVAAISVLAYSFIIRCVIGQLDADERYFSHIVWLLDHGFVQYRDFYSNHLPLYFHVAALLVHADDNLTFVYWLRALSLAVIPAYGAMVLVAGRDKWVAAAVLAAFIAFARMSEIRPDTFGLLLMNGAWFLLVKKPKRFGLATILAVASLLFSARAAVCLAGFGATSLYAFWNEPKRMARAALVGSLALVTVLLVTTAFYPLREVVGYVFLEPLGLMARVPLTERFLALPDRFSLVALTACALVVCRRDRVIAGAAATQLVMIAFDPSPFGYVYGWAAVPVAVGLSRGPALVRVAAATIPATILAVMIASYWILKGHDAPPGSGLRTTIERPIGTLDGYTTPQLVGLMIEGRQQALWNSLAIRSAVCKRVRGTVLTVFSSQPICLPDAQYGWIEIRWRDLSLARCPPKLFIWKGQFAGWHAARVSLSGYVASSGFALRSGAGDRPFCRYSGHRS
jgi:hypothetical protein